MYTTNSFKNSDMGAMVLSASGNYCYYMLHSKYLIFRGVYYTQEKSLGLQGACRVPKPDANRRSDDDSSI